MRPTHSPGSNSQETPDLAGLRAANEQLRAILDASPVAIVTLDAEGRVTGWNPAAERIFGWTRDEVIGLLPPFVPDVLLPTFRERLDRAIREEVFSDLDVIRVRKDGSEIHASLSLSALHGNDGQVAGFVGLLMDITRRKENEAAALAARTQLEERVGERTSELVAANEELEAFSYTVSHDLRAPLSVIIGYTRMLMKSPGEPLGEVGLSQLGIILNISQRMSNLIDALLALARPGTGAIVREMVDLSAMMREVGADLERTSNDHHAAFSVQEGLTADGDPQLLRIALDNLAGNAWKFTRGTPDARIEFGAETRDGSPVYFIRDNGAGFDPSQAGKLFQAFERLHSVDDFEGTGIGLATAKRIIQRHGGHIWAESAIGQGATFFFTLPPTPAHSQRAAPILPADPDTAAGE